MASSPSDPRTRPLRRDAQRNRTRIVEAAKGLFAEFGVRATLDDVAVRAGVGVATVYRHFPNRDALLGEVFEERIDELAAVAEESLTNPDAWQGFVDFLYRLEETSAANRGLEQLVTQAESGDAHERLARARERLAVPISALVARAKEQGRLRSDFDPADLRMVHAMIAAAGRETHAMSRHLWRRYFVFVVDGLSTARSNITETDVGPPPAPGR